MATKQTLTSVKVNKELFQEFKIYCVKHKFSLQIRKQTLPGN